MEEQLKHFEMQYCHILADILKTGIKTKNRTGIDTLSVQNRQIILNLEYDEIPLIKGKKVDPINALTEMLWFLNGKTDIAWLKDRGVNYWDSWARPDGTIGKSYGYQFRNSTGVDQLQTAVDILVTDPMSRRNIITLWNPSDIPQMAITPCVHEYHIMCVPDGNSYRIDLHVTQRSADWFIGVPYDLLLVAWFQKMIQIFANNRIPGTYNIGNIYYTFHDCHIYENNITQARQYIDNVNTDIRFIERSVASMNVFPGLLTPGNIDECLNYFDSWDSNHKAGQQKHYPITIWKDYHDRFGFIKAPVAV